MVKHYIFGKYVDNEKETTMSFRVSKETKELFETHANAIYGGTSNGLKEIFLDYMSQYAFRRQSLKEFVRIFVPFCENEEDLEKHGFLPYIDYVSPHWDFEYPKDLEDVRNVVVPPRAIKDVRGWDLSKELIKDSYDDLKHWIYKESSYQLEDGFVIEFPVNNQLDMDVDGIYRLGDEDELISSHGGIFIVEYEGFVYYICYAFEFNEDKSYYPVDFKYLRLVSNEEAFFHAMDCGNLELAKLIDSFNEGTSNIEHDKQLLMEKRDNLLNQVREINDKISKFEE